jgi:hypothetical protein
MAFSGRFASQTTWEQTFMGTVAHSRLHVWAQASLADVPSMLAQSHHIKAF